MTDDDAEREPTAIEKRCVPAHPLVPQPYADEPASMPDDWVVAVWQLTDDMKLRARYEHRPDASGFPTAMLVIHPARTYDDQPGLPNCHAVELVDYRTPIGADPERTVRGRSPAETEQIDGALDVAQELMQALHDDAGGEKE